MLKTLAFAAVIAGAPAAAFAAGSTYSYVAAYGEVTGDNVDITVSHVEDGTLSFAQALNVTGSSVTALYSGTAYRNTYASTRYRYDATQAETASLDASGYINSFGVAHAFTVLAAWQMDADGNLLWDDVWQYDSCATCDTTGYLDVARSWTRLLAAGDSLFLTITAGAFGDDAPDTIPSRAAQAVSLPSFRQSQAYVTRSVSFSPVAAAVPEPATWALLIAGFGLAGSAMRRRRAMDGTRSADRAAARLSAEHLAALRLWP